MGRRRARIPTTDSEDSEEEQPFIKNPKPREPTPEPEPILEVEPAEDEEPEKGEEEEEPEEEEEEVVEVKPIGEVVKTSGKGRKFKKHYEAFSIEDHEFKLEDSVLLSPGDDDIKPYVAIIKDIIQGTDGKMELLGQWFYRPEEAVRKGGGRWDGVDTRELFYSFHCDYVLAESVMHKCVVHFVPLNKQFPLRKVHPGFIVQRVYDVNEKRLWKLTDNDYEDGKQHEIDLLVQKTRERIGELPDKVIESTQADQANQVKGKRRSNLAPLNVTRENDNVGKMNSDGKIESPKSCPTGSSEYYKILAKFNAITNDDSRDKWMEKLLLGLHPFCDDQDQQSNDEDKKQSGRLVDGEELQSPKAPGISHWPDVAVAAVVALEKAAHDLFVNDVDRKKYNQKMRQLDFNLKNSPLLAKRLLNNELQAVVIVNMSPNELKEGLTADETEKKEPEMSEHMQMTDKKCSGCGEKKVAVTDIIQAGGREDRYKLECYACGSSRYASRDEISTLTIEDASRSVKNVGTAPLATAKFDEKNVMSPRTSENPSTDIFQKTTKSQIATLETQKSIQKRIKPEGASSSPKHT